MSADREESIQTNPPREAVGWFCACYIL